MPKLADYTVTGKSLPASWIAEDQKIFSSVQKVSLYKYGQLAIHTLWEPRAIQCGQTLIPGKLRGPSQALDGSSRREASCQVGHPGTAA